MLELPKIYRGKDLVFTMVKIFSKMAHFIALQKINDVTRILVLFFYHVVWLYVILNTITSYWVTKFLGQFWRMFL